MGTLLSLLLVAWPSDTTTLKVLALPPAPDAGTKQRKLRVYVDAGHGAKNKKSSEDINTGAVSSGCENEDAFTLRTSEALMKALAATGRFELKLSRSGDATPSYAARVAEAEAWKADLILGIHFDVRGMAYPHEPAPGLVCWRAPLLTEEGQDSSGFSVLWSDEDAKARPERALSAKFGRALSIALAHSGMTPYNGWDYTGLYLADPVPGGFIDRRRVWMLRKPTVPSVIVETHHALDVREWARWQEPKTHEAFAAAVAAALLSAPR